MKKHLHPERLSTFADEGVFMFFIGRLGLGCVLGALTELVQL